MSKKGKESRFSQNKSFLEKSLPFFALFLIILFIPLFVFAINTGVLTVEGFANFEKDIQVDGVIIGKSNAEVSEGVDLIDVNGVKRFNIYFHEVGQVVTRDISTVFDTVLIIENATELTPQGISVIFWNAVSEKPTLVLQEEKVGRASVFEDSVVIGKGNALLDLNYTKCIGFTLIDCDSNTTGADFGVRDDEEILGSSLIHGNLNVDGNSTVTLFYGSMFQFESKTVITIPVKGGDVNVTDFNIGLINGFEFFNNEALIADENGVYLVNWSISISNGNKRNFRAGIALNDVLEISSATSADSQASIITNLGGTGIISVNQGDVATVMITNLDTSDPVTIEYANLSLVKIGK